MKEISIVLQTAVLQARIIMTVGALDSHWWAKRGRSALDEVTGETRTQLQQLVQQYPKTAVAPPTQIYGVVGEVRRGRGEGMRNFSVQGKK